MYAPNNQETAEQISKMLGNQTIVTENVATSTSKGVTTTSRSVQAQSHALMSADQLMTLEGPEKDEKGLIIKAGRMIVRAAGFPPILGRQILYFKDPNFSARSKMPWAEESDVLMVDKHRTYMRPDFEWLSQKELDEQHEEDKRENDLAKQALASRKQRNEAAKAAKKKTQTITAAPENERPRLRVDLTEDDGDVIHEGIDEETVEDLK